MARIIARRVATGAADVSPSAVPEPPPISTGTPARDFTLAYTGATLNFIEGLPFTADRALRVFLERNVPAAVVWT
jgi:hypothetical protein